MPTQPTPGPSPYFYAGFVIPPLLGWGAYHMHSAWLSGLFVLSCVVFIFHVAAIAGVIFAVSEYMYFGWMGLIGILFMYALGVGVLVAIFRAFAVAGDVIDNARGTGPPRDVHHYHHVTTDQDLRAEVTDVRRDNPPNY
jgi:hypothetical protein